MIFEQCSSQEDRAQGTFITPFSSCLSALLCQGDKSQARLCGEFQTVKAFCLILHSLSFLLGYFSLVEFEADKDGKDVALS